MVILRHLPIHFNAKFRRGPVRSVVCIPCTCVWVTLSSAAGPWLTSGANKKWVEHLTKNIFGLEKNILKYVVSARFFRFKNKDKPSVLSMNKTEGLFPSKTVIVIISWTYISLKIRIFISSVENQNAFYISRFMHLRNQVNDQFYENPRVQYSTQNFFYCTNRKRDFAVFGTFGWIALSSVPIQVLECSGKLL